MSKNLPAELWLQKVGPHLLPKEFVRLLCVNKSFRDIRYRDANEMDVLGVVGEEEGWEERLVTVKTVRGEMRRLNAVPEIFLPFVNLNIGNLSSSLGTCSWTDEDFARLGRVGQIIVNSGTIQDFDKLGPLRSLVLSWIENITEVTALTAIQQVQLISCHLVTDVSPLATVPSITVEECVSVTDLSPLGGVGQTQVTINSARLTNTSAFGHVHKLNVSNNFNVTCVKGLASIHTLDISRCPWFTDLSPLGNIHTLYIANCDRVTNVSVLTNVHTLDMSWCPKITSVSGLQNTYSLTLAGCDEVADLSPLVDIPKLNIGRLPKVTDISPVKNAYSLVMYQCNNVTDVSPLRNIHRLDIGGCKAITDISPLKNIHTLDISECQFITDVSMLTNVQHLIVVHCLKLKDVSMMCHLQSLVLSRDYQMCSKDTTVLERNNVKIIRDRCWWCQ